MTLRPCPRQSEVNDLLASGHWPHACPADLRAHLADCPACADLVLVTQAFQHSRAAAVVRSQFARSRSHLVARQTAPPQCRRRTRQQIHCRRIRIRAVIYAGCRLRAGHHSGPPWPALARLARAIPGHSSRLRSLQSRHPAQFRLEHRLAHSRFGNAGPGWSRRSVPGRGTVIHFGTKNTLIGAVFSTRPLSN